MPSASTSPTTHFKPFQRVLVRNTTKSKWKANFFDYYREGDTFPYVTINKVHWRFCIPYDGNEHLHGQV